MNSFSHFSLHYVHAIRLPYVSPVSFLGVTCEILNLKVMVWGLIELASWQCVIPVAFSFIFYSVFVHVIFI